MSACIGFFRVAHSFVQGYAFKRNLLFPWVWIPPAQDEWSGGHPTRSPKPAHRLNHSGSLAAKRTCTACIAKSSKNPNLYNNQYNHVLKSNRVVLLFSKVYCIGYCTGWILGGFCYARRRVSSGVQSVCGQAFVPRVTLASRQGGQHTEGGRQSGRAIPRRANRWMSERAGEQADGQAGMCHRTDFNSRLLGVRVPLTRLDPAPVIQIGVVAGHRYSNACWH